jgi:uncharacterized protein
MRKNIVLDTNIYVSGFAFKDSITAKALKKATENYQLVFSEQTWAELLDVINRPKFNKYLNELTRFATLRNLKEDAIFIEPTETITDCRDPKDNKFLELAVAANADFIVTGDLDLLILHPFRNIAILKSGEFLNLEIA